MNTLFPHKQNIIDQFPLSVDDFELLELLSQSSGHSKEDIGDLGWEFLNPQKKECTQERFNIMLTNIDTSMRRKILKSINTIAKYKSQTKEEILNILNIEIDKLENQTIKDGEIILNELENIRNEIEQLEKDMAKFYFENKVYGIKFECIKPYLTQEEFQEYIDYYQQNRKEIFEQERTSGYPSKTEVFLQREAFLQRYAIIANIFDNKILAIREKYKNSNTRVFDGIMDNTIDFEIGKLSLSNKVGNLGYLRGMTRSFLEKYQELEQELKKFRI